MSRYFNLVCGLILGLAACLMSACSFPTTGRPTIAPTLPSPTSVQPTIPFVPTTTMSVQASQGANAPADSSQTPCGYTWETRPLSEVSKKVQAAFDAEGFHGATVNAEAFGEACIQTGSNPGSQFLIKETDFHLRVETTNLQDRTSLGNQMEKILTVLDRFPPGDVPGPQPGYVGVTFFKEGKEIHFWFRSIDAKTARDQGKKGAALLDALSGG